MALLWCAQPQLRHDISGSRTVLNDAAHLSPISNAEARALQTTLPDGAEWIFLLRLPRARRRVRRLFANRLRSWNTSTG